MWLILSKLNSIPTTKIENAAATKVKFYVEFLKLRQFWFPFRVANTCPVVPERTIQNSKNPGQVLKKSGCLATFIQPIAQDCGLD